MSYLPSQLRSLANDLRTRLDGTCGRPAMAKVLPAVLWSLAVVLTLGASAYIWSISHSKHIKVYDFYVSLLRMFTCHACMHFHCSIRSIFVHHMYFDYVNKLHNEGHKHILQVKENNYTRICEQKSMLTVNGQFPGPTITARKGEVFIVNVYNQGNKPITIHW